MIMLRSLPTEWLALEVHFALADDRVLGMNKSLHFRRVPFEV
jgi:hypothetical protein